MAALEEFELGIDHIRNAFKRANNGFTNAYKMLEAQQQRNHKLEAENAKLRRFARSYVVAVEDCGCHHCPYYEDEDCPTETEPVRDGCRLRSEMRELGVEEDE